MQFRNACSLCFGLMLIMSGAALSAESTTQSKGKTTEHAQLATAAAQVLRDEMSQAPGNQIPDDLLNSAQCIGVVPSKLKLGLVFGGSHGNGLVSCRTDGNQWSAPVFFEISSGSVGAQIGGRTSQLVFLFMDQNSVDNLVEGNFKFGADVGVTGGTLGAHADVTTTPASIVAYQQNSQGLFAGASVQGGRFSINRQANRELYGKDFDIRDALQGKEGKTSEIRPYTKALNKIASPSEGKMLGKGNSS